MESLKLWISGVCAVSLISVILRSILPEGTVVKMFNIVAAFAVVITIIAPIKKVDFNIFETAINDNTDAIAEKISIVTERNSEMTDDIIEEEMCEYICNKTGADKNSMSITCEKGEITQVVLHKENAEIRQILKVDCGIDERKIKLGE